MKHMRAVESDSVKLARKAIDKLHKACERASETRERTKQNESRDSDRFLVNTHVQSHALLRRGFGTSVPFIEKAPMSAGTMLFLLCFMSLSLV